MYKQRPKFLGEGKVRIKNAMMNISWGDYASIHTQKQGAEWKAIVPIIDEGAREAGIAKLLIFSWPVSEQRICKLLLV